MISIVVPTYNRAKLLSRAIESVLKQTFQDSELIVIDDGSTDNTEELIKEYAARDNRIKYIKQENSGGAARPKNVGIKMAKGEYIAILDSDDEWMPEKLETQLHYFERSENPKLMAIGCNMIVVDAETKKESRYRVPRYKNPLRNLLLRDYMGSGSCMFYRKSVFDEIGFFDESLKRGQDRDMRIRIAERYYIEFVDEYLVRYYTGHQSVSSSAGEKNLEETWNYLFNKYKKYYMEDRKLWSEKLRYEGTRYVLRGKAWKGRKRFFASFLKNPLNGKTLISLFVSLLGRRVYAKLTKYKMELVISVPFLNNVALDESVKDVLT